MQSKRRRFGDRTFLVWAEDCRRRETVVIHTKDEANLAWGCCELSDREMSAMFDEYLRGSRWPSRDYLDPRDHAKLLDLFVESLVDTMYFETNTFGDQWIVRIPSFDALCRREHRSDEMGPRLELGPGLFHGEFGPAFGTRRQAAAPTRQNREPAASYNAKWRITAAMNPAGFSGSLPPPYLNRFGDDGSRGGISGFTLDSPISDPLDSEVGARPYH